MIMSGRSLWRLPKNGVAGVKENPLCPPDLAEHTLAAVFRRAGYDTVRTCKKGNSYEAANAQFEWRWDATKRQASEEEGSAWHTEQLLTYLDERQRDQREQPFLLYFGFSHPHDPRWARDELLEKYGADNDVVPEVANPRAPALPINYLPAHPFHHGHPGLRDEVSVQGVKKNRDESTIRNEIGRQFACSENIDRQIERVLARLQEMGELENTYVLYTADHGMAIGRHGLQGKQNLYEHTWRVPLLVSGPGIAAGSRAQGNVYLMDLLATLCDLAEIEVPPTSDGRSFRSVLEGREQQVRDVLYGVYSGGTKPGMRSVRRGDWKLIQYDVLDGFVRETQLFHLGENPWELLAQHHDAAVVALTGNPPSPHHRNLAEDPEYAEPLAEMKALLRREMERWDDPYRLWDQPEDEDPRDQSSDPRPATSGESSGNESASNRASRGKHSSGPSSAPSVPGAAADESRPNIVVLYADDLGYGDVQCYNPKRGRIPTPHIDRLAAEGMRFNDAHSSSAVCSPSRYTLLTGRYHWRTRLQRGIVDLWGGPVIEPERLTIAGLASEHGYRTACVGKWHLGWHWPISTEERPFFATTGYGGKKDLQATEDHRQAWRDVFSRPIPGGPTAVGFDEYFGTDVPNWPPYCFLDNDRAVGIPSEFAAPELFQKNQASQQGPALAGWTLEPILPELVNRTVAFVERESRNPEPFLLYFPLTSPHTPLAVNEPWNGASGLGQYADFVMETDAAVGQVLECLETCGVSENTLVVFTSDNGCAPYIGMAELEEKGHFASGPLRGAKSDAWEGGHRVPFLVRWPGVVAASSTCDQLVHQADLLATLADVLGAELPEDAGEDSFSLGSLLRGTDTAVRDHAVSTSIRGIPSVRLGSWKYIAAPGSGGWTKSEASDQPVQLYDLGHDLGETQNLAAKFPERVTELQSLLENLIATGRSNGGSPQSNDVEVVRFPRG